MADGALTLTLDDATVARLAEAAALAGQTPTPPTAWPRPSLRLSPTTGPKPMPGWRSTTAPASM